MAYGFGGNPVGFLAPHSNQWNFFSHYMCMESCEDSQRNLWGFPFFILLNGVFFLSFYVWNLVKILGNKHEEGVHSLGYTKGMSHPKIIIKTLL